MNKSVFLIDKQAALNQKVNMTMLTQVYSQTNLALISSFFCAVIVLVGLYPNHLHDPKLYICAGFYLLVMTLRMILVWRFKRSKSAAHHIEKWKNLYAIGALLGGSSWGLFGALLLATATPSQQALMILMLAGVTAGAVPISCYILRAGIAFLVCSILPYIVVIAFLEDNMYLLFNLALSLYLIYTIILSKKSHDLIRHSTLLKFENDFLVVNLSEAKTQLEESNKKLERAASHDPLTQVANRRLFHMNLSQAIRLAQHSNKKAALLYIDLDNFKQANDVYGHHVGDFILIEIIDRLRKYFGYDDLIARLGGDEITVILENVNNTNEISEVAREICRLIAMPIKMKDSDFIVSASIGISVFPEDGDDTESLIRQADDSMYQVKAQGGNNFSFYNASADRK